MRLENSAQTPRPIRAVPAANEYASAAGKGVGRQGFAARGEMDLIRDLASPLPLIVIAEMLGIPTHGRHAPGPPPRRGIGACSTVPSSGIRYRYELESSFMLSVVAAGLLPELLTELQVVQVVVDRLVEVPLEPVDVLAVEAHDSRMPSILPWKTPSSSLNEPV